MRVQNHTKHRFLTFDAGIKASLRRFPFCSVFSRFTLPAKHLYCGSLGVRFVWEGDPDRFSFSMQGAFL
jgi:hypothetical protein